MTDYPEAARPLAELKPKHELLCRHRLGRLRLRHDGDQAQGVLYAPTSSSTGTCRRSPSTPARRPSSSTSTPSGAASTAGRRWSWSLTCCASGPRCRRATSCRPRRRASARSSPTTPIPRATMACRPTWPTHPDPELEQAWAWTTGVNATDRRHGPRRAALSLRAREPGIPGRQGRHDRRVGHARWRR